MKARVLLGAVAAMGVVLAALFFFYAASGHVDRRAIPVFGAAWKDAAIFGGMGLVCLRVCWSLMMMRKWAWWVAGAGAFALCSIALLSLWWAVFPRDEFARRETGGYAFFLALVLGSPSMLAMILLMLPEVRRAVFRKSAE